MKCEVFSFTIINLREDPWKYSFSFLLFHLICHVLAVSFLRVSFQWWFFGIRIVYIYSGCVLVCVCVYVERIVELIVMVETIGVWTLWLQLTVHREAKESWLNLKPTDEPIATHSTHTKQHILQTQTQKPTMMMMTMKTI